MAGSLKKKTVVHDGKEFELGSVEEVTRDLEIRFDQLVRHHKGEDVGMKSRTFTLELTPAQAARRLSGLSQTEFSKKLGISTATLRNWEQGRREPTGPAKVLLNLLSKRPELLEFADERAD